MWIAAFMKTTPHLGASGVVRGHDGTWITGFTHFENGGDALLAELRATQLWITTYYDIGYTSIICESDNLEAVNLIHNLDNASLHVYAYVLLEI